MIPTCNRRDRLLSLLQNLHCLFSIPGEVIIVDSGEQRLSAEEINTFTKFPVHYLTSEKSVCIQRNTGIRHATCSWIFLCDDDIEIPKDYLDILLNHVEKYPQTGAVSGCWLQLENNEWRASYPVTSSRMLLWKYIFQLGIWGEIKCNSSNYFIKRIEQYYKAKGNHISKAGWPVNIDFGGEYINCPVYSLGASLIKKEWLTKSPYDEVLDAHGIGDNYGVIAGFPPGGIQVVTEAHVYHHREPANRLKNSLQYYRRILALDYFIKSRQPLRYIKRYRLVWSLIGNLLIFLYSRDGMMTRATLKAMSAIIANKNPYSKASGENKKIIEPVL